MDSYVVLTSLSDGKYIIIQGRIGSVDSNLVEDRGVESGSCLAQNNLEGLGIVGGSSTGGDANVVVLACLELDRHSDEVVVSIVGRTVGIVSAIGSTPSPSLAIAVGINDIEVAKGVGIGQIGYIRYTESSREEYLYLLTLFTGTACVVGQYIVGVVANGQILIKIVIAQSSARSDSIASSSLNVDRLDTSLIATTSRNGEDNLVGIASPSTDA